MLDHAEKLKLLRLNSFLGQAPLDLLEKVADYAVEQDYQKGDFIYSKNDPADNFYILVDGQVGHPEVQAAEEQFSVARQVSTSGQLFGFAAIVQGLPQRVISARCEKATKVLVIDGQWFQNICKSYGQAGHELLQELTRAYAGHERTVAGRAGWISIRNAGKVYDPYGKAVMAVDDCSIEIRPGEFVAIVGPSGCGKSTLLNGIAGFDDLTSGIIYLDGEVVNRPGRKPKPGPDRMVVFQNNALFPWATIIANLICGPLAQKRMGRAEALEKARALLAKVGLSDIENLYPGAVSGGMARRVEIIRAILNEPRVILLDEPFRGVDALTKSVTHNALLELYDLSRKTVMFITHDLEEAIYLADRVLVMTSRPGRIKQTIYVNLPRPRTTKLLTSLEFLRLKDEAIEAVHEEAVKAFTSGEREFA
jgi:NitT/TauT family transport system ATP-binding protein